MNGDHSRRVTAGSFDRRSFLRAAAAVGGGTFGAGTVTSGVASAQGTVTTDAAVPSDAPTLDNSDYTGLFVHLGGRSENAATEDVGSCQFVEDPAQIAAYDVVLVDRETAGSPQATTRLFSRADDGAVEPGGLFIVTGQQSCDGGPVQLALERVGAAEIDTAQVGVESGVADDDGGGGAETGASSPGFGVGAALAGLLGAGELVRRRE